MSAHPSSEAPAGAGIGPGPELLKLQELDLSVDRMRARIDALESQGEIRAAADRAAGIESAIGELKLSIDEVSREQVRLETDIDSMERKIEAERRRLFDGTVANAKELQSIEAEVANLTRRRTEKEDRVLELMERREELDGELRPREAKLTEARDRQADVERASGQELGELRTALKARVDERGALAGRFDPEVLELYEDLRQAKKGLGAAALVDGVCQGCHQQLSPMYMDRMRRSDGMWRCEYCRRILVAA